MNKTLIKNFAIDARVRLIQMAIDNAGLVGIAKDKIDSPIQKGDNFEIYKTAAGTDYTITGNKIKQRKNLVERIKKIGFEQVMEETAYTWFNRIIAIRYMEVNDYLPTRVRVLSSETAGKKEPDIITHAPDNVDLNFTEAEKQQIRELKAKQKMDEVFQLLFIKQCNELNKYLPKLFEKTSAGALDYTELLFNLSFTRTDGVLARLLEIEEEDFKDQVQIIGWMYQYYNTELKDDTFAKLKKNVKITKERIPAATQLFTPDWIVRYMVENSLGRLYAQSNTAQSEEQTAQMMGWKYYLPQAEQTEEVQRQLDEIKTDFNLETVKVLDPCMGSGHILVYAFDVLIQMYKNAGYNERDAAQKIMQNNIFGLDIDNRAAQLAYFALMMKGRQYDRRFFERDIEPKVYAIQESNGISEISINKVVSESAETSIANYLINTFHDAKEYGSIIDVEKRDYDSLKNNLTAWKENHAATFENALVEIDVDDLLPLIEIAKVMSEKYDVVVTNPPYMGHSGMSVKLSSFAKKRYPDSKNDLFSIFIEKGFLLLKQNGYLAYITMQGWMFLSSYTKLRKKLVDKHILSLLQIGFNSFPGMNSQIAHAASFIIQNNSLSNFIGQYFNLNTDKTTDDKELVFQQKLKNDDYFLVKPDTFKSLPNYNFAYWISKQLLNVFSNKKMKDYSTVTNGMFTCNNNLFLRIWSEIDITKFFKRCSSKIESCKEDKKWYPYNKGGDYRRWYGNHEFVINFAHFGEEVAKYRTENGQSSTFPGQDFYFKESLSWSFISTSSFAIRYYPEGFVFDIAGSSIFLNIKENQKYFLGLLSSSVVLNILNLLNPTINYQAGDVRSIPVIITNERVVKEKVSELVDKNINYSKTDWDSFETSWDFTKHPLLPVVSTSSTTELFKDTSANSILISDCYAKWEKECSERFATLKSNEEELNRIFIEIYGLQDELTPEVKDKDVTVRLADRTRDVKSFISYAVGCMFGRYSLSKDGLAYAGGNMDMNNYKYFIPDADNVIPVTDEEYFSDDIVTRFVEFVRQVYGESTLEENLRFITESLPNKGDTPKEIFRSYFLNDFYKDHCKIYQKRPIYWMFDSGKENGFKALIYMHRYDNQTPARVRTDYMHKLQTMYEAALVQCKQIAENPATAARDKALAIKRITKITKQLEETKLYDQALGHIASQYIDIDLDDGVNVNYEKFQGVQVAREGQKAIKIDLLGKRG